VTGQRKWIDAVSKGYKRGMIQRNPTRQRRLLAILQLLVTPPRPPFPFCSHAHLRSLTHPSALTTGCLSHRDIDKFSQRASSMEDGYIQHFPQISIESYTTAACVSSQGVYTQIIGEFDSQRPNVLSWNHFPPRYNQV
jgi:hypothetical protein